MIRRTIAAIGGAALAMGLLVALPTSATAHGSLQDPASRTYQCRFVEPDNPQCQQAWAANPQALYDWMEVNIGHAAGRHEELIPDGKLCSANRPKYAAFDVPSTHWPATVVSPGPTTMTWASHAPHSTAYYRVYLTGEGFDPLQPLRWSDLELLLESGPRPAESTTELQLELPERQGRHVVYTIWQRDDSPEAFYSCSDVDFGGIHYPDPPDVP